MKEKHKTSLNLDKDLWAEWVKYVVNKTGSTRTIGNETSLAIREYMERHPLDSK